jgi:hypothetical protein
MADWHAVYKGNPNKFEASFPATTAPPDLSEYVRLKSQKTSAVLWTSTRQGASGNEIFVSKSSDLGSNCPVVWEAVDVYAYRWYVFWHDRDSKLALFGLALALVGVCTDAFLAIGKNIVVFRFSDLWLGAFSGLSYFLKGTGLFLAFWGVILKQASKS